MICQDPRLSIKHCYLNTKISQIQLIIRKRKTRSLISGLENTKINTQKAAKQIYIYIINLRESLGKYHLAQCSDFTSLSTSLHVLIAPLSMSRVQIKSDLISLRLLPLHLSRTKKNIFFGHSSTQTCGVGHPFIGTNGDIHFSILKNNRYGFLTTSLSTPHRRPVESAGTRRRSKSPRVMAGKRHL